MCVLRVCLLLLEAPVCNYGNSKEIPVSIVQTTFVWGAEGMGRSENLHVSCGIKAPR